MSTSPRKSKGPQRATKRKLRRAFVPTTARAKEVEFDADMMWLTLTDGRVLGVPLAWFSALWRATPEERARCEIGGGGIGLHWPDLDEDLSVAGLLAGVDASSS
jgi:hypothetical protein